MSKAWCVTANVTKNLYPDTNTKFIILVVINTLLWRVALSDLAWCGLGVTVECWSVWVDYVWCPSVVTVPRVLLVRRLSFLTYSIIIILFWVITFVRSYALMDKNVLLFVSLLHVDNFFTAGDFCHFLNIKETTGYFVITVTRCKHDYVWCVSWIFICDYLPLTWFCKS